MRLLVFRQKIKVKQGYVMFPWCLMYFCVGMEIKEERVMVIGATSTLLEKLLMCSYAGDTFCLQLVRTGYKELRPKLTE